MKHTPRLLLAAVGLFVVGAPATVRAQLADAKILTLQAARSAITAAEAEAKKNGWTLSFAVVDAHGELIAFERMDDAPLSSVTIAQGKARTAARFKRPTKSLDSSVTAGRVQLMAFDGLIPVEGGVPITIGGRIVGAIGASGAQSFQDAQAARMGADAVKP